MYLSAELIQSIEEFSPSFEVLRSNKGPLFKHLKNAGFGVKYSQLDTIIHTFCVQRDSAKLSDTQEDKMPKEGQDEDIGKRDSDNNQIEIHIEKKPVKATRAIHTKPPLDVNPAKGGKFNEQYLNRVMDKQKLAAKKEMLQKLEKHIGKKRPRNENRDSFVVEKSMVRYDDFGGIDGIIEEIRRLIEFPFKHPELYETLNVEPTRGILLSGPPGSGKTLLADAIASELEEVTYLRVSAPELVSGMSGESEAKIRSLFQEAQEHSPSLIFIDEIDAIAPKRQNSQRGMEKRMVAQICSCIDSLQVLVTGKPVIVIAATSSPDSLDSSLRRAGRFTREIGLGVPDEEARKHILTVISGKMKLSGDFDFGAIAKLTPGYVGADLHAITQEAATQTISRAFDQLTQAEKDGKVFSRSQLEQMSITMDDFTKAIKKVQPSAKREGFATVPNVTWDDVGALDEARKALMRTITNPIEHPEAMKRFGLNPSGGVLLYGPPGCGKTLLAKAIANQAKSNFISVKGPELLNKFVGESERAVRTVFSRARASSPCIIFFDELDALCPKRGFSKGNASSDRIVNQLLTELDGIDDRKSVYVIAATNRPDIIDSAILRPGRLDKLEYVPIPDQHARFSILKTVTRNTPLSKDVDLRKVAVLCENYSGADLASLNREACLNSFDEYISEGKSKRDIDQAVVSWKHWVAALKSIKPSISKSDREYYESIRARIEEQVSM